MNNAVLILTADEDEETIAEDAREITRQISMETRTEAHVIESGTEPGERGAGVAIGQISLAFLTGGSAVALLDVLRPWFDRRRKGKIEIKLQNGTSVLVESDDLHDDRYDALLELVNDMLMKETK